MPVFGGTAKDRAGEVHELGHAGMEEHVEVAHRGDTPFLSGTTRHSSRASSLDTRTRPGAANRESTADANDAVRSMW